MTLAWGHLIGLLETLDWAAVWDSSYPVLLPSPFPSQRSSRSEGSAHPFGLLPCGSQFPRWLLMTPSLAFMFLCSLLYQGWSAWPVEYGTSDSLSLLRLGYKKYCSFSLSLSLSPPRQYGCGPCSSPHGEELKPPASSHMGELGSL